MSKKKATRREQGAAKKQPAPQGPPGPGSAVKAWITKLTGPFTLGNLAGWIGIVLLVLVVRWAIAEPYKIPSGSMEPTLHGDYRFMRGDRVFISKFHYGLMVPFTNRRMFRWNEPERWELVVFRAVQENAQHGILIKRIVGLPGERIQIRDGRVYADGEPLELPDDMPDVRYTSTLGLTEGELQQIRDHFDSPGEQQAAIQQQLMHRQRTAQPMRYGVLPGDEYSVVPEDHYFVLGDNSANSIDGRHYGWVPNDNILGRAFCIWWPPANWRDFTGFSRTWWGMLLLYGVPAGAVGYFVISGFFLRSWRLERAMPGFGLEAGDHILVHRSAYGLRAPFLSEPLTEGRPPQPGEIVAFAVGDDGEAALGRVLALPGQELRIQDGRILVDGAVAWEGDGAEAANAGGAKGKKDGYAVLAFDEDKGAEVHYVPADAFWGRVARVWWPLRRARRVAESPPS